MLKSKKALLLLIPLVCLVFFMLKDSFTQKSVEDIPGEFKEAAFIRNEQNKGGIIRIYAVTVGDPQNANYQAAADLFPVNDYGSSTTIYFFDKTQPYPTSLSLEAPHFDGNLYKSIHIVKVNGSK
ncbi:hypothetical protein J5U18_03945 [Sphingobacteriaceae bacterium WQ 2009]|uniref:Uncharacterized protein n=1 Tax=Rhinopithecimicrobium faecis TaxID=2820698 RepID=A0A8T4H8M3_9SPHI|nr:hypothetical protein [Sphingobacteriaceae bacterium WQ 2009]